jgi:hypothetical protein
MHQVVLCFELFSFSEKREGDYGDGDGDRDGEGDRDMKGDEDMVKRR